MTILSVNKPKKKKKHKNLLVVTNVNSKNKLVHFSAYTLPDLTENGNKEKPKKDSILKEKVVRTSVLTTFFFA